MSVVKGYLSRGRKKCAAKVLPLLVGSLGLTCLALLCPEYHDRVLFFDVRIGIHVALSLFQVFARDVSEQSFDALPGKALNEAIDAIRLNREITNRVNGMSLRDAADLFCNLPQTPLGEYGSACDGFLQVKTASYLLAGFLVVSIILISSSAVVTVLYATCIPTESARHVVVFLMGLGAFVPLIGVSVYYLIGGHLQQFYLLSYHFSAERTRAEEMGSLAMGFAVCCFAVFLNVVAALLVRRLLKPKWSLDSNFALELQDAVKTGKVPPTLDLKYILDPALKRPHRKPVPVNYRRAKRLMRNLFIQKQPPPGLKLDNPPV